MLLLPFRNIKSYHLKHKCGEVVVIGEERSEGGESAADPVYTIDYRGNPEVIPGTPATPSTTENNVHIYIYLDYTPGELFKTKTIKGKQSGKGQYLTQQITRVWSSGWGENKTNTSGWIDGEEVEI